MASNRDNDAMDDTHEQTTANVERSDQIEELADLDPADAPEVAEDLAAQLAAELEAAGTTSSQPASIRPDPGDLSDA